MLKRLLPRSLYKRTFLIIALPVVIMQSIVTYVFFERHWDVVTGNLSASTAGDIAALIEIYDRAGGAISLDELRQIANEKMQLSIAHYPGRALPGAVNRSFFSVLDRTLQRELSNRLSRRFWFDTTNYPDYVEVQVQIDDGVLRILALKERVFAVNGHIFLFWMFTISLVVVIIALVFLRTQVRPIQRLAHAAEQFGRGQDVKSFRPAGASEVRQAAKAFIGMRERIKRHIHQRTSMLAAVSHDLRTPITRIKLALAMQKDTDDIRAIMSDVAEMETMLDEYLAFARSQTSEEAEALDLSALLEEIRADAERAGQEIALEVEPELTVAVRRNAIKRSVHNLISNAQSHASTIRLSGRRAGDAVEIAVDDDGPGISPENYEEAFRPFSRLDASRNQNTGGVGLGLALVRDIARGHGGDVKLSRSALGGLRAVLRIPV